MAQLSHIVSGLKKYIDVEMLPKITGLNKWIFGAAAEMALDNAAKIFDDLKNDDIVKMLDVIDKNDEIDIDKLYQSLLSQSQKSAVTFDVKLLGTITLRDKDIQKLYKYIKESL